MIFRSISILHRLLVLLLAAFFAVGTAHALQSEIEPRPETLPDLQRVDRIAEGVLLRDNVRIDENRDGKVTITFDPRSSYMPTRHGQVLNNKDLEPFGMMAFPDLLVQECGTSLNYSSQCLVAAPGNDNYVGFIKGSNASFSFEPKATALSIDFLPITKNRSTLATLTVYDAMENVLGTRETTIFNTGTAWGSLAFSLRDQNANQISFVTLEMSDGGDGFLVDNIVIARLVNGDGQVLELDRETLARPTIRGEIRTALKEQIASGERPRIAERNIRKLERPVREGFKTAEVDRLAIDWSRAKAFATRLKDAGVSRPGVLARPDRDRVELPILVPARVTSDPLILAKPDFYYATVSGDGWFINIHGTRLTYRRAVFYGGPDESPSGDIEFFDTETGIATSFALFGAHYAVSLTCDTVETQALCADQTFLASWIDDLVPSLGAPAGEE
jgi:hypothetical protein